MKYAPETGKTVAALVDELIDARSIKGYVKGIIAKLVEEKNAKEQARTANGEPTDDELGEDVDEDGE